MAAPETPFSTIVNIAAGLEATTKRLEKRRMIAEYLRILRPDEIPPAALLLVGKVFPEAEQKALNVGWATLRKALGATRQATLVPNPLTILDVQRAFDAIAATSGKDSVAKKRRLLEGLLGRATPPEQEWLLRSMFTDMRIGVNDGVMLEALADAANVDLNLVRLGHMFTGDIGRTAAVAVLQGEAGLSALSLRLFTPVKLMMAEMAGDLQDALDQHGGETALEYKFDGARIQVHRRGDEVRVFSRRLTDVTASVPEVTEVARRLPAKEFLIEGEVVALDAQGKPRPFQDLMRRFRRVHDIDALRREIPLRLYVFDIIYRDGEVLIGRPYRERWDLLASLVPPELLARRTIARTVPEIEAFLKEAMEAGHEGLMAKALDSDYVPGKRGKKWFKIKPVETLDCAIVAAEWGHGRRTGTLSNVHLAVQGGPTGEWAMIGKTFKGLTDAERLAMTERLQALKTSEDEWTVHVRPEIVIEVAYNEIQRSPRYPSGFALRFARISRVRDDKGPGDADTYERLEALYAKQFERKGAAVREP
ncbi:MAG: ATP-dependent DNA ligase [Candidatus Thermoplasmatota archaeon]